MLTSPPADTSTTWSRGNAAVDFAPGSFTNGRRPAVTLRRSLATGAFARYCAACSRRNWISPASGRGSSGVSETAVSVVPISTRSCHGMTKSTRPSSVRGTISAVSPPRNSRGNTR